MPPLNWVTFNALPGSGEGNFEMLCRILVRQRYGKFGTVVARANQPGVEFHIRLRETCPLGNAGTWFGWQCKWYQLGGSQKLTSARKKAILESLKITVRELPELTDWVLWTREPLSKSDQDWFYALPSKMRMHLWNSVEIEQHLCGDGEIFRSTYFGDLVLLPEKLTELFKLAVQPILPRWMPLTHQTVDAERMVRRLLFEAEQWSELSAVSKRLEVDLDRFSADISSLSGSLKVETDALVCHARACKVIVDRLVALIEFGDLDLISQACSSELPPLAAVLHLPYELRKQSHRSALSIPQVFDDLQSIIGQLSVVRACLSESLIAVVANAGCGKTQLSAQLAQPGDVRPAGILLHGSRMRATDGLDDLARIVVIHGHPVKSMEALLGAVDAAGRRAKRRLPVVIDGLNESQDPRRWKGELALLKELARRFPYVFVVVTVREEFVDETIGDGIERLQIENFGDDTSSAVWQYFDYYMINPGDAELPWDMLSHPLTLRMFCEVTNPKRETEVGVESMPLSLTALFDRYLTGIAERIATLSSVRYSEGEVRKAIGVLAKYLWEHHARNCNIDELRSLLHDSGRVWNDSIVRALEQESVLLRGQRFAPSNEHVSIVYDALAGHVIAESLLMRIGNDHFGQWISEPANLTLFSDDYSLRHPLASDVFNSLIGLVPRRFFGQQLWKVLPEPMRSRALYGAAYLESAHLDSETIDAIRTLAVEHPSQGRGERDLFRCFYGTRSTINHPFNAEFLDATLRPMAVADRDARWTEWVRQNEEWLTKDLEHLEERWRSRVERNNRDRLLAMWCMWILTSTVRKCRDQATRSLYWYGRGRPSELFALTLESLSINDEYVTERMLAASFGVTMANQIVNVDFSNALADYLRGLSTAFIGCDATNPTSHYLVRLHVQGTFDFARRFCPNVVPEDQADSFPLTFTPGPPINGLTEEDPLGSEINRTLGMDFENYTIGGLFHGRRNYDMEHEDYNRGLDYVRGTVLKLGWRESTLGKVDDSIRSNSSRGDRSHVERYGKKYGWLAYYALAGMRSDSGQLNETRLSELGVDPSFPETAKPCPIQVPHWATDHPVSDVEWIRTGVVSVPDELLYCKTIESATGPWIAMCGRLTTEEQSIGREVWGHLVAMLVDPKDVERLKHALTTREYPGNHWLPDPPHETYTFAGEIPWSNGFAENEYEGRVEQYFESIKADEGAPIDVEILAHEFGWESYHSELNQAGHAFFPSFPISERFDLRGVPSTFNQIQPDGKLASLTFDAPVGFRGRIGFLREDIVREYADGRSLVWMFWGERQLRPFPTPTPEWYEKEIRGYAMIWRLVRSLDEVSKQSTSKTRRTKKKSPTRKNASKKNQLSARKGTSGGKSTSVMKRRTAKKKRPSKKAMGKTRKKSN